MILTGNINEANDLLTPYRDGRCRIAYFSQTFRKLALIIESKQVEEVIYITGAGCEYIKGPFSFPVSDLKIERGKDEFTVVSNELAGFELKTKGGFSLVKGRREQFSEDLDDFFLDKSELPE